MDHQVNKSCEKNFDRIDKNVDDLDKKLDENVKKLTALETNSKNVSSDHDTLVILGNKVGSLETTATKNTESLEKVTSNLNNFAALQNNMIDKLSDLTKKEEGKNNVKTVIITGVLVTVIAALVLFVIQVLITHMTEKHDDNVNSGLNIPKTQTYKKAKDVKPDGEE